MEILPWRDHTDWLQDAFVHAMRMWYSTLVKIIVKSWLVPPISRPIFEEVMSELKEKYNETNDMRYIEISNMWFLCEIRPKATLEDFLKLAYNHPNSIYGQLAEKMIASWNIDLKFKDYDNKSILHYMSQCWNHEFIWMLLDLWADPNDQDKDGNTVLHAKCAIRDEDIVNIFLQSPKINVNIRNNEWKTPADVCMMKKTREKIMAHPNYRNIPDLPWYMRSAEWDSYLSSVCFDWPTDSWNFSGR